MVVQFCRLPPMVKFYYDKSLKYTNRQIITTLQDFSYIEKDYVNIDSPDSINGHIIYQLEGGEEVPTYLVEENGRRWYVSGITQLRTGKFQISLIRDIISETPLSWRNENAYISAGTANNYNKYKLWELPFTNTKISEEPLIISGVPSYFVFYTNTQHISDTGEITEDDLKLSSNVDYDLPLQYDEALDTLQDYKYYKYIGAIYYTPSGITVKRNPVYVVNERYCVKVTTWYDYENKIAQKGTISLSGNSVELNWGETIYYGSKEAQEKDKGIFINYPLDRNKSIETINRVFAEHSSEIYEIFRNLIQNIAEINAKEYATDCEIINTNFEENNIAKDVGKIFLNRQDGRTYKLLGDSEVAFANLKGSAISEPLQEFFSAFYNVFSPYELFAINLDGSLSEDELQYLNLLPLIGSSANTLNVYHFAELNTVQTKTFDFNFTANTRKLPKSAVRCVNIVPSPDNDSSKIGQALMQMSANTANLNNDTGQIIDIQYLPFSIATQTNNNIKINDEPLVAEFLDLDDYYFVSENQALTNINKETDTVKIISPSRATQFSFSPYNNDGNMNFDIKTTIRPFNSVIYIRPHTTGLLLYDFDDKNCLIIDEDFSLTLLSSEWSNYIRQNRNYKNTFDREIQGREFERTWERRVEAAQAKTDEWTARNISAQKAATYTGNIPILSGIASAIGTAWKDSAYMEAAQTDREYNEALYQESLSLSKDMFNYQLDNIKSQPTMPSKITTIDIKFLGYCYIEFWSTNETEKAAIQKYYNYNGNRIDDYGTFNEYWGNFVRGKIIRSINYTQPELNELNRRLQAGIFTGGINGI